MGARKQPAIAPAKGCKRRWRQFVGRDRPLEIAHLTHVIGQPVDGGPAKQRVAERLHQTLAIDHPAAFMRAEIVRLLGHIGRMHRGCGLLDLQKKRIVTVIAEQHHAPGPKPHTAHADHPMGHIGHRIALQHEATLGRQGFEIVVQACRDAIAGRRVRAGQYRRLVDEAVPFDLVMAGHTLQKRRIVGLPGLFFGLAKQQVDLRIRRPFRWHVGHQFGDRGAALPQREHRQGRAAMHDGPIAGHRAAHRMRSLRGIQADLAPGDFNARGQAFEVPLPGADQHLVEIVQIDHDLRIRRAEHAEVVHVRIAVEHHVQPARGQGGEVGSHHRGRAAQKGEGRDRHARHAQRHQRRVAPGIAGHQTRNRIEPVGRRLPVADQ